MTMTTAEVAGAVGSAQDLGVREDDPAGSGGRRCWVAHLAEDPTGIDGMLLTSGPRMLNRCNLGKTFRPAAETIDAPGARLPDVRHYYASLLIRHGESVKVVQARPGHASARETLDTYSH